MARTPYSDIPRGAAEKTGIKPIRAGLIFLVLTVIAVYFAFSKANPFSDPYELNAVFDNANELKERSPVRIAGVEVGKVKSIEPFGDDKAKVRMEIDEKGLPIKEDAQVKVRQRIFLEGNYFVDLQPGTSGAPERKSGSTIPPSQTAAPVQFGQVLSALQSDTREDLKTFLKEYAKGVEGKGSRGFNMAVKYWEAAYRNTAIATRATLGQRPGDLQRVLKGQGKVFGALSRDEESLKLLVTSLNRLAAAFAREEGNLQATIPALRDVLVVGRPALASLNDAFPTLRAFAREALPAARSSSPTLDVQIPFITQARRLVSRAELRGLVADLRPTVPDLARLNRSQTESLEQTRALASCQLTVLLPFSKTPIPDPDFGEEFNNQPFYEESTRSLVGLSGESRMHDANSPIFRVLAGGGGATLAFANEAGERVFSQIDLPIEGVRPIKPAQRPVFRPNIPCETQEPPDMAAATGPGGDTVVPTPTVPKLNAMQKRSAEDMEGVLFALEQMQNGKPYIDPLDYSDLGERIQAKQRGFKLSPKGYYVPRNQADGLGEKSSGDKGVERR